MQSNDDDTQVEGEKIDLNGWYDKLVSTRRGRRALQRYVAKTQATPKKYDPVAPQCFYTGKHRYQTLGNNIFRCRTCGGEVEGNDGSST